MLKMNIVHIKNRQNPERENKRCSIQTLLGLNVQSLGMSPTQMILALLAPWPVPEVTRLKYACIL